jgi:hypothetical protein
VIVIDILLDKYVSWMNIVVSPPIQMKLINIFEESTHYDKAVSQPFLIIRKAIVELY